MIHRNDVIQWNGDVWRVLHIDAGHQRAALILLKEQGMSTQVCVFDITTLEQTAKIIPDTYAANVRQWFVSEKMEKQTHDAYELIFPIISKPQLLYSETERIQVINDTAKNDKTLKQSIRRYLSRYWQRGQNIFCLQPDQGKRVGKRVFVGSAKPGVKSQNGWDGTARTPEIEAIFDSVAKRYLITRNPPLSIAQSYKYVLQAWRLKFPDAPEGNRPSMTQYSYYITHYIPAIERIRSKSGEIAFGKDIRPVTSTVYDIALGPGFIYEIDSTVADIYLVSSLDRDRIIGRPTLYVVTDVFSGMIVGVSLTWEKAQYIAAADALYAAICNKSAICSRYPNSIKAEDWIAEGIPAKIHADNAELLSEKRLQSLVISLGADIAFMPSYHGDAKGSVEKSIDLLQKEVAPFLPGKPAETIVRKAGGRDTRKEAAITLDEYVEFILRAIVHLNNRTRKNRPPSYPPSRAATPLQIWKWGIECGMAGLTPVQDTKQIRRSLLLHEKASVSRNGITLNGFIYGGDDLQKNGWMLRSSSARRPPQVEVVYDPADISSIEVVPDSSRPNQWWKCILIKDSARFLGKSLYEAQKIRAEEKMSDQKNDQIYDFEEAELNRTQEARADELIEATRKAQKGRSHSEKIREIRSNLQNERIKTTEKRLSIANNEAEHSSSSVKTDVPTDRPAMDSDQSEYIGLPVDIEDMRN